MNTHKCRVCKQNKESSCLYEDPMTIRRGGKIYKYTYFKCRECNTIAVRKYIRTKKGISVAIKNNKNYRKKNPKRLKAWVIARKIPLQPCIYCGATKTHRHHPDVDKPKEIVFLCPKHHKEAHKNLV